MFNAITLVLAVATAVSAHGKPKPHPSFPKGHMCPGGQRAQHPTCCSFYALRDDLNTNLYQKQCGEDVHEVLRLSFHDAAGYSVGGKFKGTGADGSMILFSDIETKYGSNAGIDDSVDALKPYLAKYNVTAGDLIQFAAAVGITNCPGAPRLEFKAGRPNAQAACDDGSLPDPTDPITKILNRAADMGLQPTDMVSLLASHTIAKADHVDPTHAAVPLDTTPGYFDTQFFLEIMLRGRGYPFNAQGIAAEVPSAMPQDDILRLKSDWAFAHDPRTSCQWQSLATSQRLMMDSFKDAMSRMAIIGQHDHELIDCSDVIPEPLAPIMETSYYPLGYGRSDLEKSCRLPMGQVMHQPPSNTPSVPAPSTDADGDSS